MCASRTGLDVAVGGASNPNVGSKAVNQRHARRRQRGNTCRHYCSHHQELMDHTLWRKLPREVVQHVCAFLPFSKTLELQKLCKPLSMARNFRQSCAKAHDEPLSMARNFRQSCAKAHDDLFGIFIDSQRSDSYRIAVSNSMHTEWFDLETKNMPADRFWWENDKELFAHDGGLVCILRSSFTRFEEWEGSPEPPSIPSIFVFNPLTGDKRDIPLSNYTCSKKKDDTEAILLQLIVDSETGCYEVILVTQSGNCRRERKVYRCELYFDCCSKQLCRINGQPFDYYKILDHIPEDYTFVRDHRFEIDYIDYDHGNDRSYCLLKMSESVWDNGWTTRSTTTFEMEEPPNDLSTRIFVCLRYLLVVAEDVPSDVFEHCHQRMLVFDRKTRKAAYDIPNFWREYNLENGSAEFLDSKIHVMCDLKWNVVP